MKTVILTLLAASCALAQSWTGILPSSRAIDWSKAGLPGTFLDGETTTNPWTPPLRTQCGPTLTPSGGNDVTQIENAFNGLGSFSACTPPYIVLLGSGNFQITSFMRLGGNTSRNNVTLRGSGPMTTTMTASGAGAIQIGSCCIGGGAAALTSLSSNFTAGQTTFHLQNANASPFAGAVAYFQQCDNGFAPGTTGVPLTSSSCTGAVSDPGQVYSCSDTACAATGNNDTPRWQETQEVLITSATNTGGSNWTVTTSPGLYLSDWSFARGATLAWDNQASYTTVGVGIEDMTIRPGDNGTSILIGQGGYADWLKGTRIIAFNNGTMAATSDCEHCLMANNYFFANNPTSPIAGTSLLVQDTHGGDTLEINNIGEFGWFQDDGSMHMGNVVAYNYDRDSSDMNEYQATLFTHGVGSNLMLRESNEWGRTNDDDTFTSHNFETDFRNNLNCADAPYDLGTTVGGGILVGPYARFENAIGNAIGFHQPTYPTPKCPSYQSGAATDGYVWSINYNNPSFGIQSDSTGLTTASFMRWGNVSNITQSSDTPTNSGIRFVSSEVPTSTVMPAGTYPNAVPFQVSVPATTNLPCSFFLPNFTSTTCVPHYSGGTGLNFWKVCISWSSFPGTCTGTKIPPFPTNGPDVLASSGAPSNYANDIPAAIAWLNLPTDTSFQNTYTVSSTSWATNGAGVGTETLNLSSSLVITNPEGGFVLNGAAAGCYPSSGSSFTGRGDKEIIITSSNTTTIKYELASNPGVSCTGTVSYPDVRKFDESIFQLDPTGGNSGTSGSGGGQACNGFLPYPCARQDLALQLESALPVALNSDGAGINFPAGSKFVDPDFGETVIRVTDNNSIQGAGCFNSTAQNTLLRTSGNPDLSTFSSDGTSFYVTDLNSNYWLYSFNPTTGAITCAPTSSTTHALPWHPAFLHHTAGQMIGQTAVSAATPWIIQTANTSAPTTVTTAVDFSGATTPNCGAGNASWLTSVPQPNKSIGASPGLWLSNDDSVYEMSIGNSQNQFWLSMFYNTVNHECAWVDTRTGQVGGNLVTTGTLSGAFPLDWGSPRAPTAPTVTQTTGGSLTSGHTYDVCYSLAELTRESGTGETSCSSIQRITLSGGNNALSIPSPAQCSNGQNCDIEMWNYYNVYANDEANCSNAQCPATSMWIQPAANLGCALATPTFTSGNITPHVTGSTNYAYAEIVWNGSCGTFTQASISNGASTVDSSHFNTITGATVSGGQLYMIVSGGIGNTSVWPSTVYGSSTVDAASPSGGGTPMFPGQISDGGGSAPSPVDNGSLGINLFAMATIPLCSGANPSNGLLSGSCSLAGNNIYSATNNTTLTTVSTSTGITAPTKTTLGLFQHASIMGRSGAWHLWGQEPVFGSSVIWNLGTLTDTMCNVNKANEYPSSGTYFNCPGHGLMGISHQTLDVGTSNVMSPATGSDSNFSTLCIAQDSSFPVHSNAIFLTSNCGTNTTYSFPAADPNDPTHNMAWDDHGTWAPSVGYGSDTNTEYQQSWDASQGTNSVQYPTYIGRGWEREIIGKEPDTTIRRYVHTGTSVYPYFTTTPCVSLPLPCFNGSSLNYDSYSTESQDGHWALWSSDMNSSLGCIPQEIFPITGFTAPNQITISASDSNTPQAPLTNQVGTVLDTTGVTGLNGQWTASSVTGSNPYTVTLTGASLSGTVSGGTWQNCTFDTSGRVNGPVPASTCGSGAQACQTGQARVDVWLAQKK